jgi:RNA polymerase sigma-70 factor (ECF subfamily)
MPDGLPPSGAESSQSTSSSLIQRVKSRDPVAWQRFVTLYGPMVYDWSRKAGLQSNDSADVVQEVFHSVATGLESFQYGGQGQTFRGWLWTITRNKIRDFARRRVNRPDAAGGTDAYLRLQDLPDELPEASIGPTGIGDQGLVRRALELVRAEFEERTWQAFWRVTMEDARPADVATELGMSVGAVYMAKSRVLNRLRRELAEEYGADGT